MNESIHHIVKNYYGKELEGSADLQTDACCSVDSIPESLKPILAKIHPQVSGKYYGCGLVAPEELKGLRILDLGSGSGQDCYVLSALVSEHGSVVGVDMTDEQLAVAEAHREYHAAQFGYRESNVSFVKGYLESLDQLNLADESFDLIVSNCVINLCADKQSVLDQAYRLLKPGGEMYFSDVYSDRRIPAELVNDPVLYGECLSGAMYWNDFLAAAKAAGFADPRLVSSRPLAISNADVKEKVAGLEFSSALYRLFKVVGLESSQENYGQTATYLGTIGDAGCAWSLDKQNRFAKNKAVSVSGNTAKILAASRFARHFDMQGGNAKHSGQFPAVEQNPFDNDAAAGSGCC
ncbi:MAG: methyltransferase domain-containing protein [bacterium]